MPAYARSGLLASSLWLGVAGASEEETRLTRMTTYTAINAVRAFAISAVVTGSTAISIGYVVFNAAADAVVYAGSDSLWDWYWPIGRPSAEPIAADQPAALPIR